MTEPNTTAGTEAAIAAQWEFFVDESGRFERPDDDVVCAGLVVNLQRTRVRPEQIRQSLEATVPELAWPWHAAHYLVPIFVGMSALLCRAEPRVWSSLSPALQKAVDELHRLVERPDAELASVFTEMQSLRCPSVKRLREVDRYARVTYPALHREFRQRADRALTAVKRVMRRIATRVALSDDGAVAAHIVGAGETATGATYTLPFGPRAWTARYDLLLACLTRRLTDVLHHGGASHCVRAFVLARDAFDAKTRRVAPMTSEHVARTMLSGGGSRATVCHEVAGVPAYSDTMPPALVLADFVANQSRTALRHNRSLAYVEGALRDLVGLAPRSGTPSRTHLVAEPDADASAESARAWAREASAEWAGV